MERNVIIDKCTLTEMACSPKKRCPSRSSCEDGICICDAGFHWKSGRCVDFDECAYEAHDCPSGMLCVNESPGFSCACRPGFRLQFYDATTIINESNNSITIHNATCADIDECAERTAECEHTCENTDGSYYCHCPEGNVRIDRYCYPFHMPREIIKLEKNVLHFGTLFFHNASIKFEDFNHTCGTGHPTGMAYDQSHRKIFFLSSNRSTIFHDNYQKPCEAFVSDRKDIRHVVIDHTFENIYWIEETNLHVKSVLTGRERLLKKFDEPFQSMMIDPAESYLGLVGAKRVYKVDLDGTRVETVYEHLNISRIFLDADGSPIYLANETLISCPSMGAPIGNCSKLDISAANKLVLGVYMNFVLLINDKRLLEVVSENSQQEFQLRIQYSNDTLFQVVQVSRAVNSTYLCQSCDDICLNSGTTLQRCRCGDKPCSLGATAALRALILSIGWEGLSFTIAAVLPITLAVLMMRKLKRGRRALDVVGFDSTDDNVVIEPTQTVTPCIDVCMKSQLIENS